MIDRRGYCKERGGSSSGTSLRDGSSVKSYGGGRIVDCVDDSGDDMSLNGVQRSILHHH